MLFLPKSMALTFISALLKTFDLDPKPIGHHELGSLTDIFTKAIFAFMSKGLKIIFTLENTQWLLSIERSPTNGIRRY
ncbi:hypothetical protein I312_101424 [Cryptococcus bacillisporus CA1280]|uniref:uncharacterized protein n=1 Tax=Cryptococcus bacillisporus CA1280 TaxID=1296109 RepID=UPI0033663F62